MSDQNNAATYGKNVTAVELAEVIADFAEVNAQLEKDGLHREVLSIWGHPGIGKTSILKQLEAKGYDVIDVPMAQFEEMGDISGMPDITTDPKTGKSVTTMAPPFWVPTEERKGVLLFDDFNRASSRILRGTMQLLQNYQTIYWKIPSGYSIVVTANPDDGSYIVTNVDSAILTRLKHITLVAEHKAWAEWAEKSNIPGQCINFILRYPEMLVTGQRTNPRSLTQWFQFCKYKGINEATMDAVETHGLASVDEEVVASFITFLQTETEYYIEPLEILDHYPKHQAKIKKYVEDRRIDAVGIMLERVKNIVIQATYDPGQNHGDNLKAFLKDCKEKDLIFSNIQQIISRNSKNIKLLSNDDEIAELIRDVAL